MHTAFFWCGCQQAFEKEPPRKCQLHGDTLERVVKEPPPEPKPKPKPKRKAKAKPKARK